MIQNPELTHSMGAGSAIAPSQNPVRMQPPIQLHVPISHEPSRPSALPGGTLEPGAHAQGYDSSNPIHSMTQFPDSPGEFSPADQADQRSPSIEADFPPPQTNRLTSIARSIYLGERWAAIAIVIKSVWPRADFWRRRNAGSGLPGGAVAAGISAPDVIFSPFLPLSRGNAWHSDLRRRRGGHARGSIAGHERHAAVAKHRRSRRRLLPGGRTCNRIGRPRPARHAVRERASNRLNHAPC